MMLSDNVISDIRSIINNSREKAIRAVDTERVLMYWRIGQRIFHEEQEGKDRADYGKFIIKTISEKLRPELGSGYSIRQLERYRQFYRIFPITSALRTQLNWTHYKTLLGLGNQNKIDFYVAETVKNNWSARQLERQINSSLFERLLMSNNQEAVMAVAKAEQYPTDAKQIIKDPMYLEFLGLKKESSYYEKDLESAIITNLQEFLLELGNGFSFVARQKRIHIDGDDFFCDLVLYNRLLSCLTENPTIGILLCADKNDALVKFTLPENNQTIVASRYQLYLPTAQQLIEEMNKEIKSREE